MNLWSWKTWKEQPYLVCALLPQPHGFFTSCFYPQTPETLVSAIAPSATVHRVKQVHSAKVLTPSEIEQVVIEGLPSLPDGTPAPFPLADGVLSEQSQQSVWACSADCTPALIGDVKTGQVAAVHAGWRGTAQQILPATVERLLAQGSEIDNLRVALGPAIDGCVYQVGKDVAVTVGKTVASGLGGDSSGELTNGLEQLSDTALLEHLMKVEPTPVLADEHPERVRLDVRKINQMQLMQLGLLPGQVAIAPHCTYQEPDRFFSYRRTHEKQVQWSGIVSAQG